MNGDTRVAGGVIHDARVSSRRLRTPAKAPSPLALPLLRLLIALAVLAAVLLGTGCSTCDGQCMTTEANCVTGESRGTVTLWLNSNARGGQLDRLLAERDALGTSLQQVRITLIVIDWANPACRARFAAQGVDTVPTLDVCRGGKCRRQTGWPGLDRFLKSLGLDTPAVPVRPEEQQHSEVPPRQAAPVPSPVSRAELSAAVADVRSELSADLQQLRRDIDGSLAQWKESFDAWDAAFDAWDRAQADSGQAACDGRCAALGGRVRTLEGHVECLTADLLRLQQALAQVEAALAALPAANSQFSQSDRAALLTRIQDLERLTKQPFEVQLFFAGEPISDVRSVQPHGGWLPINVNPEVEEVLPTNVRAQQTPPDSVAPLN